MNEAPRSERSLFLLPYHLDGFGIRQRLAVHRPVNRAPGDGVGIDAGVDAGASHLAAIRHHAGGFDRPLFAIFGPGTAAEAAVGLEDPGTDHALRIVLTDELLAALDHFAPRFDRVLAAEEGFVFVPVVGHRHFLVLVRRYPGADGPIKVLEAHVVGHIAVPLADDRHFPLPALANE